MGLQPSLHLLDALEILRRSRGGGDTGGESVGAGEQQGPQGTVAGEWGRMSSLGPGVAAATSPADLSVLQRGGGLGDSGTESRNLRSSPTAHVGHS